VQLLAPENAFLQILLHTVLHHQMSHHTLRTMVELGLLLQQGADLHTMEGSEKRGEERNAAAGFDCLVCSIGHGTPIGGNAEMT
jgi:hypothetical protein